MRRIALPLILSFSFVSWAYGQETPTATETTTPTAPRRDQGVLRGSIHLPRGEHEIPKMMTVTLYTLNGSFIQQVVLNQEMFFAFRNVQNDHYILRLESLGYETTEKMVEMRVYVPDEEIFVTLTLGQRLEDPKALLPDRSNMTVTAISARALDELEKAEEASKQNNPEKAIEHLRSALEAEPGLYIAYNNLAVHYLSLGQPREAMEALQESIRLNPDDATAHRNLAQLQLGQGAYREALASLQHSLKLLPMHSKTLQLMGETFLGIGQYQLALSYFQKAANQNPADHSCLGIARCYLQLGHSAEALAEFKEFITLNPKDQRTDEIRRLIAQLEQTSIPRD